MGKSSSPSSLILSITLRRSSSPVVIVFCFFSSRRASHLLMISSKTASSCRRARQSRRLSPVTTSTNRSDGKRSPMHTPPLMSSATWTADKNLSWSSASQPPPNVAFTVIMFAHDMSSLPRLTGLPPLPASRTSRTRDMVSLSLMCANCFTFRALKSSTVQSLRSVLQYAPYGEKAMSRFP